jgi:hypothetical protein
MNLGLRPLPASWDHGTQSARRGPVEQKGGTTQSLFHTLRTCAVLSEKALAEPPEPPAHSSVL